MSKTIIDLKAAAEKAANLTMTCHEIQAAMENNTPVTDEIMKKFSALSALPDCKLLLEQSDSLTGAETKAKDDLTDAFTKFTASIPSPEAAFETFKEFIGKQWHENMDGTNIKNGEVSLLLSAHQPSLLFTDIGAACYAGHSFQTIPNFACVRDLGCSDVS